jgi:hypothetical protein
VLLGLLAAFWSAVLLLGAVCPAAAAFWSVEVLAGGFAVVEL